MTLLKLIWLLIVGYKEQSHNSIVSGSEIIKINPNQQKIDTLLSFVEAELSALKISAKKFTEILLN